MCGDMFYSIIDRKKIVTCVFWKDVQRTGRMGKCIELVHRIPIKKYKLQNISVVYDFEQILYISKIKTVACHIAIKICVSIVKLCFRNSQIPYFKANSIFKKSFVISRYCWLDWWCLTPQSTAMFMSGQSVHLTALFYRTSLTKQLTSTLCTYFRL